MESRMSVGLDPSSIGMPGQPLSAITQTGITPPLRLSPPVPSSAEWRNPLSAQPFSSQHTPRYSPAFLVSPGVSADIAGVVNNPDTAQSNSLSDLFSTPEYPFSTVKTTQSPNNPSANTQRTTLRPSQPPALQPPHNNLRTTPKPPTMSYPSTFRAPPLQRSLTTPQTSAHPPIPSATASYAIPTSQHVSLPLPMAPPPQQQAYGGYSVLPPSQHPQAPHPQPQPPRVEPILAPMPSRSPPTEEVIKSKEAATLPMPTTGHRSVLGSGIVSSAVQEAQVRARIKAENFAKNRKRKRHEDLDSDDKSDKAQADEDSNLSPEQLRKKRYMRRLALNRESAAVSRVRRREYVKLLEEQLVNAEKERVRLATELGDMQSRHGQLRDQLIKLEDIVNRQENGREHQGRGYQ